MILSLRMANNISLINLYHKSLNFPKVTKFYVILIISQKNSNLLIFTINNQLNLVSLLHKMISYYLVLHYIVKMMKLK